MTYHFQNTYTKLSPELFQKVSPPHISDPKIILLNVSLLKKLGIGYSQDQNPNQLLGDSEEAFAQAYAGHQFGHFTNLGDGRAMIIGEHLTPDGNRFDIQLKGSGITKYSRGGDGKAALSSMIREYVYSSSMKNLGVKSSESLAVIATNKKVPREELHEGAILIRVMASHIRFGTCEYLSTFCTQEELREFTDYAIERHYPRLVREEQKYLKFFQTVLKSTVDMVVDWYRVGFIHGVMNTDNMSITGETFDYGPCAFINRYDPFTTFSRIDARNRYAFANQKEILKWNLGVFGNALLSLFHKDTASAETLLKKEMDAFDSYFENTWLAMMKKKVGITNEKGGKGIIEALLHFLEKHAADYTNTFVELMYPGSINDGIYHTTEFLELRSEIEKGGLNLKLMQENNPQRIPRNYLVEEALDEYIRTKNADKLHALLEAVSSPYVQDETLRKFQHPPSKEFDNTYQTHCNT